MTIVDATQVEASSAKAKPRKDQRSRTMRIEADVYNELSRLKRQLADRLGQRRMTFSEVLTECSTIAKAWLTQPARYAVGNSLYSSIEEARGAAIQLSVKTQKPAQAPELVFNIATDDYLR